MKLYEVKYEEDGQTLKAPGISETEIKRCSLYYAAESLVEVWEATEYLRKDPERRYVSIAEVLPAVVVIPPSTSTAEPT